MIWPGRTMARVLLLPALLSLFLFISDVLSIVVITVDVLIGFAVLLDLTTLMGATRFRAERHCSSVGSIGEPQKIELKIESLGTRGRLMRVKDDFPETFDAEPSEFLLRIPRGGHAAVTYTATPKRRGTYTMKSVFALIDSRLGFWQRSAAFEAETVIRVYPDIRQIAQYTLLAQRDKLSTLGMRRSRRLGTDNEFERLRDYTDGDEPRHMDWRATARRRKLTVRAHQTNQSQRLIFLIDCGRMMAGDTGGGFSPLDHAFNAMLMLAHVALIRGDQVGLLAFSDRLLTYVPPSGGAKKVRRLVHSVHNIFPEIVEPRYDRAFVELEKRCRKRSLIILMTNIFDDVNADIVSDHLVNMVGRHLPLGVFLRDQDIFNMADQAPDQGPGLYTGAAAAAMLNWRERVLVGLRHRGALTLDTFPDDLTAPLINRYLQIKARHLL
ncbi:DUF58 domain-containing protein [Singulisphaera sp. PoT]|uniref:DUF58 domain-containing protein n=1 Tax=Singulisphaera sp. PoT TaxID=3411797 RepID=UPI003BF4CAB7